MPSPAHQQPHPDKRKTSGHVDGLHQLHRFREFLSIRTCQTKRPGTHPAFSFDIVFPTRAGQGLALPLQCYTGGLFLTHYLSGLILTRLL
jgi:hypothetical protein